MLPSKRQAPQAITKHRLQIQPADGIAKAANSAAASLQAYYAGVPNQRYCSSLSALMAA